MGRKSLIEKKANFGTWPVFLTAVSTILGAILFLRFGWAIGQVGFVGIIGIIIIGHIVTFSTALAIAEIATNQKVQGGGAYFIISRSFGFSIGGAIGITLFLSQAISVAFYIIAFSEAFIPLSQYIEQTFGIVFDPNLMKYVALSAMAILAILILFRGAKIGMKALYVIVAIMFTSIFMFLFGESETPPENSNFLDHVENPENFFYVFTIIFPAFTGIAAGLGLSGDLKDPKRSIPRGTLLAALVGMVVYVFVAIKFVYSAEPDQMAYDQDLMSSIAVWGPIIPIGLAAATLSSALGSILIAPRTLQAIGIDDIFPNRGINKWFAKGKPGSNEPVNATLITIFIAFIFVAIGDMNVVAEIISMFFMVTYAAICSISFLEHFAADPSYRPTFRSRWYISLAGALFSFWLMFQMNMLYAVISLLIMVIIYYSITYSHKEKKGLEKLFKGVVFQLSRQLQVIAQRADKEDREVSWRPFIICISEDSFKRRSAFDLLRWISFRYGFGTFIHFIKGYLSSQTNEESKDALERLIQLASGSKNRVYLDTIISPSYTSAIAQVIQLSGISGKGNNMILFEFSRTQPESLDEAIKNYNLLKSTGFDVCFLNTSYKGFGYKKEIHIWITVDDYENANLMILLAYIILGHPEWKKGFIKILAIHPEDEAETQRNILLDLIKSGRLPISPANVETIVSDGRQNTEIINEQSVDADLTIIGFLDEDISKQDSSVFNQYKNLGNVLFINSNKEKEIK